METADAGELLAYLASWEQQVAADEVGLALLVGARGCAQLGGVPAGSASPVAVPECAAVVLRRGGRLRAPGPVSVGSWQSSWTDDEHAAAVGAVREAIARGDLYQANVVGHRWAALSGDPWALPRLLPPGAYAGSVGGDAWLVASASPEQLVRVVGRTVTTTPIKGTSADVEALRASAKDRAEHVMIVDLERNDLARICETGSVQVEGLYALEAWAGLWHASTVVTGALRPDVGVAEVLRALLPGGSVTGAPKHAACTLLAGLEPVGRGPSMGALGFWCAESLDLGLTIRTLAVADGRVHLWAGGGITWGSDPATEVAEARAKATPVQAALAGQVRPSSS